MALSKQIAHAWRGAKREVAEQRGAVARLLRALRLVFLVMRELLGTAALAPYGLRAALCRHSLVTSGRLVVHRYGDELRNSIEVITPAGTQADAAASEESVLRPVVCWVNGGVWSAGDAWQFAPLARTLSDAGAVVCLVQYSLYPSATVPTMVAEVCEALEWCQRNACRFGGDAERVTLLGHSAGAHLAACAVVRRSITPPPLPQLHAFVGVAGVYDVEEHFRYETQRGVQNLSTMEAAMGGQDAFARHSPCLALGAVETSLAARLPPMLLLSSLADSTVPTTQSDAMLAAALSAGACATHLVYDTITHLQFATAWEYDLAVAVERSLLGSAGGPKGERVMAHAADVITVVSQPSRAQVAALVKGFKGPRPAPRQRALAAAPLGKAWATSPRAF